MTYYEGEEGIHPQPHIDTISLRHAAARIYSLSQSLDGALKHCSRLKFLLYSKGSGR